MAITTVCFKRITCVWLLWCLPLFAKGLGQGNAWDTHYQEDMETFRAVTLLLVALINLYLHRRVRMPAISIFDFNRRNLKNTFALVFGFVFVSLCFWMLYSNTNSTDKNSILSTKKYETSVSFSRKEPENALLDYITIFPGSVLHVTTWLHWTVIIILIILNVLTILQEGNSRKLQEERSRLLEEEYSRKLQSLQVQFDAAFARQLSNEEENSRKLQSIQVQYDAAFARLLSNEEEKSREPEAQTGKTKEDATRLYEDTLVSCESLYEAILNSEFVESEGIFGQPAIDLLRLLGNQCESNRKRKHIGTIVGSSASIVGGGLSIAGAVLSPFTFGISIGLMIAGVSIGAAGSGLNIGFSVEKFFKDRNRTASVKPALESYIEFNKLFLKVLLQVCAAVGITKRLKTVKDFPANETFTMVKRENERDFERFLRNYDNAGGTNERLECITQYSDCLVERLKKLITEVKEEGFINAQIQFWTEDFLEKTEEGQLQVLPVVFSFAWKHNRSALERPTFARFAWCMLQEDGEEGPSEITQKHKEIKIDTGFNAAKATMTAGRVCFPAINLSQDAATLGPQVARIVQAASAATIVLSSVGVVLDVAFIGHSVYKLVKNEPEEFTSAVFQLAKQMEKVNSSLCPEPTD